MRKKRTLFIFILFPLNAWGLIKVDITRGNLDPLPLAVSPLAIDNDSRTKFQKILKRNNQIRGVKTNLGIINCEYIVLCAGMWSRQIGEAAGISIPLYPNEHFYMIT